MHNVCGVGVDSEGHTNIGVTQHLLGGRGVDAFIRERGGEGVPEAVEGELLVCEARSLQERLKPAAVEVPRVHGFAEGVGEDEIVVFPEFAGL